MKSILDPSFHYVSSVSTDVRKTFARVRREMQKSNAQPARSGAAGDASRVVQFPPSLKAAQQR